MSKVLSDDQMMRLRKVPLFQGLTVAEIRILLDRAVVVTPQKGALLFSQGEKADHFYAVLEGQVKLFTTTEEGEENVVEIISPLMSLAEAAIFLSARFPVNGETLSPCVLVRIEGRAFLKRLEENSLLAQRVLSGMAQRHRLLLNQVVQLKTQSPAQRLGTFFLSLVMAGEGEQVPLPYDKHVIAARVGMKPESLSRALIRLRDLGVDCQKRSLIVADVDRLRRFCEGQAD
ncbi:Crp/Fnr family transcriptional regulator [Terasakiella pusilla]|uniref:Crp/Fnr family transcriptional regulator n=1 Tax=Terasakiella pusilla TaxID=64973 RepID=UPI003AA9525F